MIISKEYIDPRNEAPTMLMRRANALGLAESNVRRWLGAVLGDGQYAPGMWVDSGIIPKRLSGNLLQLPQLTLERVQISKQDNFQKFLFRTADGLPVETVAIPLHKPGCVSICLSSQVGCVMGCVFCATARMKTRRNLETWEIIDQFIQVREAVRKEGRKVTGAVFMGMGEPFLNYDRVLAAAELLCFPVSGAISSKSMTISTVGLVQEIDRFTEENRPFRLSISLGAATDEKRARLVPIAARTSVSEVMQAATRYALKRKQRVNLAYVCIRTENVSVEDARQLALLIGHTPVRLDLIDVSDATGRFEPPTSVELKEFRDALNRYLHQPVARRYSGGRDINAACGMLAGG